MNNLPPEVPPEVPQEAPEAPHMDEPKISPEAPEGVSPGSFERPLVRQTSRGWLGRVGMEVLGRWGARLGAGWLVVLAALAVLAPLIASSHPILIKAEGRWSSPMLRHLTAVDVILLVGSVAGMAVWGLRRVWGNKRAWWVWVGVVSAAAVVSLVFVRPPKVVVYSQYREAIEAGDAQHVLHTLIPYSPTDRLRDLPDSRLLAPSKDHWMGTTAEGEDMLSRMIHATRIALAIGFIATGIAVVIGVVIGGVMGYFSGWVDLIGMRLVEVFSAIPTIFLLIAFVAFYGRNLYLIMAIIGLTDWVGYAVFVRAEFLKLRQQDFVYAARACGLPLWSILFRHMLPNGVGPVLVNASFGVASAILAESTLSFLGLGLVEEPSWGQLLDQARGVGGSFYWWIAVYPGLAIFLTVFAYNLIGEAMRDALDPRLRRVPG